MEGPDTAEMPLDMGGELVALGEQLHDRERIYQGRDQRINGLWIHADRDGIDRELAAMTVDAEVLRQPSQRWHLGTCRTVLALAEGRFEEAEALLASTLEAGRSSESWNALVSHRLARFVLRRAQGRLSESEEDVRRAVEEFPALLRFSCALAHLQAEIGDHGAAAASLDALLARDLAHEHLDADWLFSICLLPDVCRVLEDGVRAAPVAQLLRPYAALYAIAPTEASFGSVARGLGVLATVAGDVDDAHRHFVRALDTERRMRARPWMAETQLRLAELLERRGEPGDAVRADELRREAAAAFHSLGMATWAARAEAVPGGSRSTC
jgi:tetratricopeptide (TPR) repeat protein